jgi:hypothetical protein
MYINDKMKNKKYHTVGTIQKSNMILMIKTEA